MNDTIGLYIENFEGIPYTDEENSILMRFGTVFQQSYTRFLDLQKSEAQTKEAQIEAALEKVRSRSLAMHKSEELNEVILEVHQKFKDLDISMESRVAVVAVFDEDSNDFNQYVASHDISNMRISTPYFKHPVLDDIETAKEEGIDFYSKAYSLKEKNSYFKTFFETSDFGNIEGIAEQRKWALEQKFYTYSPTFQKNSSIGIADFSGIPLTENAEVSIITVGPGTNLNDSFGHNVAQVAGIGVDGTLDNDPPGGVALGAQLECAGTLGCHGDRTVADPLASLSGAHHSAHNVVTDATLDGSTVGLSFRYLLGVLGREDSDWQFTETTTDHNRYNGLTRTAANASASIATISGLCAQCHGAYHNSVDGAPDTFGISTDNANLAVW